MKFSRSMTNLLPTIWNSYRCRNSWEVTRIYIFDTRSVRWRKRARTYGRIKFYLSSISLSDLYHDYDDYIYIYIYICQYRLIRTRDLFKIKIRYFDRHPWFSTSRTLEPCPSLTIRDVTLPVRDNSDFAICWNRTFISLCLTSDRSLLLY